jgi:hypothetical protein
MYCICTHQLSAKAQTLIKQNTNVYVSVLSVS